MACTTGVAFGAGLGPGKHQLVSVSGQYGRTLLEMLIVVAIIGLVAAIAVPSASSTHLHRLVLAGSEVAEALRFAREEARRTGIVHGVSIDAPSNLVRVFRLDQGSNPNLKIYDVYQPITKQLYAVDIDSAPYAGVALSGYGGQMIGSCSDPGNIAFDPDGVVRCVEPIATRISNASVELTAGQLVRTIAIDSYSGRVSIQ